MTRVAVGCHGVRQERHPPPTHGTPGHLLEGSLCSFPLARTKPASCNLDNGFVFLTQIPTRVPEGAAVKEGTDSFPDSQTVPCRPAAAENTLG